MVENLLDFRETGNENIPFETIEANELTETPINQQTVLLVEQNALLADVISRDLMQYFKTETVNDGYLVLKKIQDINPDAIIIDTDLEGFNAYELVSEIKKNARFSLIPIIIISNFDDNRSIIRAIRSEADDYLQKPFNCEVLKVMIIKKMKKRPSLVIENIDKTEVDKEVMILEKHSDKLFMDQLDFQISSNMSNPDFDVNMLADILMISRGQLYKKLKTLKNVTPLEYLRDNRLSKAAELIKESQDTIQQIMHQVGMPDATNFYQRFKEKYGMSPLSFRDK
jgi:DNA-binding response OmpR family regulator